MLKTTRTTGNKNWYIQTTLRHPSSSFLSPLSMLLSLERIVLASLQALKEEVADKIAKLGPEDWGDVKVLSLKQNRKDVKYVTEKQSLSRSNEPCCLVKTLLEMLKKPCCCTTLWKTK